MTAMGTWQVLGDLDTFRFNEYYSNGKDIASASEDTENIFCVEYMINQFTSDGTTAYIENLYDVTVRVSWPKNGQYPSGWTNCAARAGVLNPSAPANDDYNQILLTRVITRDFSNKMSK
jgi:hypothetical protein